VRLGFETEEGREDLLIVMQKSAGQRSREGQSGSLAYFHPKEEKQMWNAPDKDALMKELNESPEG